jgi:hypothetical protein
MRLTWLVSSWLRCMPQASIVCSAAARKRKTNADAAEASPEDDRVSRSGQATTSSSKPDRVVMVAVDTDTRGAVALLTWDRQPGEFPQLDKVSHTHTRGMHTAFKACAVQDLCLVVVHAAGRSAVRYACLHCGAFEKAGDARAPAEVCVEVCQLRMRAPSVTPFLPS